jgi:aspartate aminotransferase
MTFPFLSRRVLAAEFSPNAAASQRAKALKAEGVDVLDLTIGEPDFDTPQHIRQAAEVAMARGDTRYTATLGTAALRAAVSAKFQRENSLTYPPSQIAVANGAKQVIYNALAATLDAGSEVIIPAPFYPSFPEMVRINGGKPVLVPTGPENSFKLNRVELEAAITPHTRWLIINSPGNPAGGVYQDEDWLMLADVLRRHPQLLLMLDEVYEHILFVDAPAHFLHLAPDLSERVLLVNGVSKTYAMTGWRIGYAAGPQALIDAMGVVQSQSTSGASSISQAAAVAALNGEQSFVAACTAAYRQRRDILLSGLSAISEFRLVSPAGGLFVFIGIHALLGRRTPAGDPIIDDSDFTAYLLDQAHVAGVAGSAFGLPGYLRLSVAVSTDQVLAAPQRIASAVAALRQEDVVNG